MGKNYTLRTVTKPLKSEKDSADKQDPKKTDPQLRAENEDDDGYDPYSDRKEHTALFEQNPWD